MNRTLIAIGLLVLVASGLVASSSRAHPPPKDAETAALRSQIAALRHTVASLTSRVDALQAQVPRAHRERAAALNLGGLAAVKILANNAGARVTGFKHQPNGLEVSLELPGNSLRDLARLRGQVKAAMIQDGGYKTLASPKVTIRGAPGQEAMQTTIQLRR